MKRRPAIDKSALRFGEPVRTREPAYIARAADAQHRLGTNDPNLIEKVEI